MIVFFMMFYFEASGAKIQEHEAQDIQLETAQPLLSDLLSTNSEQQVDSDQQIPLNESKPEGKPLFRISTKAKTDINIT